MHCIDAGSSNVDSLLLSLVMTRKPNGGGGGGGRGSATIGVTARRLLLLWVAASETATTTTLLGGRPGLVTAEVSRAGLKQVDFACNGAGGGGGGGGGGDTYRGYFAEPGTTLNFTITHERHFGGKPQVIVSPLLPGAPSPFGAGDDDAFQDGYTSVAVSVRETWWQRTSGEGPSHRFGGSIFDDDGGDDASPTPAPTEDDDDDDESGVYVTSCVATVLQTPVVPSDNHKGGGDAARMCTFSVSYFAWVPDASDESMYVAPVLPSVDGYGTATVMYDRPNYFHVSASVTGASLDSAVVLTVKDQSSSFISFNLASASLQYCSACDANGQCCNPTRATARPARRSLQHRLGRGHPLLSASSRMRRLWRQRRSPRWLPPPPPTQRQNLHQSRQHLRRRRRHRPHRLQRNSPNTLNSPSPPIMPSMLRTTTATTATTTTITDEGDGWRTRMTATTPLRASILNCSTRPPAWSTVQSSARPCCTTPSCGRRQRRPGPNRVLQT